MRGIELGKVAAQAELLRVKRIARRTGTQIVAFVVAGLFGLFALAFLHVLAWQALARPDAVGPIWASAIVLAVDLVIALIGLMLGRGKIADPIEIEARITRDRSLTEMRNAFAFTALTAALTGPIGRRAGMALVGLIRRSLRRG